MDVKEPRLIKVSLKDLIRLSNFNLSLTSDTSHRAPSTFALALVFVRFTPMIRGSEEIRIAQICRVGLQLFITYGRRQHLYISTQEGEFDGSDQFSPKVNLTSNFSYRLLVSHTSAAMIGVPVWKIKGRTS